MAQNKIYTKEDFEKWINNKDFIFDTTLFIKRTDSGELEILIYKKIEFANLAGEKEKSIVYSLQTHGFYEMFPKILDFINIQGKYLSELDVVDAPFMLKIKVEGIMVNINCKYLIVKRSPDVIDIAKPKLNSDVVKFSLNEKLPLPSFWIEQLKKIEYDAMFIGYFGEEILLNDIPIDNYSSFSIKPLNSDKLSLGVNFCKAIGITNNQSEIILNLHDSTLQSFWKSLLNIACSLNVNKIKSGNIEFCADNFSEFQKVFGIVEVS